MNGLDFSKRKLVIAEFTREDNYIKDFGELDDMEERGESPISPKDFGDLDSFMNWAIHADYVVVYGDGGIDKAMKNRLDLYQELGFDIIFRE